MTKKLTKSLVTIVMISFVIAIALAVASPALAGSANNLLWGGTEGNVGATIGLGNEDPRIIAAGIINVILGFLGIIAVVIVLLGGFKWMTAGGNEDKVAEAKKLIVAGVIGLVIILASWGISKFVIDLLYNATNAQG
jgi:Zn-dependent protease with chaperone function